MVSSSQEHEVRNVQSSQLRRRVVVLSSADCLAQVCGLSSRRHGEAANGRTAGATGACPTRGDMAAAAHAALGCLLRAAGQGCRVFDLVLRHWCVRNDAHPTHRPSRGLEWIHGSRDTVTQPQARWWCSLEPA